jgi:sorting and assembly machinery component 37
LQSNVLIFEQQILDKARSCLEIYSKLLGDSPFFFHERYIPSFQSARSIAHVSQRPTSLDIIVASHVLLLLNAPFPDSLISDLLIESFSSLVIHSRLILYRAFQSPSTTPPLRHPDAGISWRSLIPRPKFGTSRESTSEVDRQFAKMRWGWVGLALLSTVAYLWINPVVIVIQVPYHEVETELSEDEEGDDIEEVEEPEDAIVDHE